jgi:hypothetical protein
MNEPTLPNELEIRTYIKDIYVQCVSLGRSKTEFHTFLQKSIAEIANNFSLMPTKEYVLPNFGGDRDGWIDVVWCIGSIPVVAIEIDSICRTKSIKKLLASNANLLFWVYYGHSPFESFVKSIDLTNRIKVIHFPTRFGKFGVKPESDHITEISKIEAVSSKSYTVSDVRLRYPNAYEKWSNEQDKFLKENFPKGMTVSQLAKHLQRKPGAIRSRIKKLGLH